jgi:hypothetical protein
LFFVSVKADYHQIAILQLDWFHLDTLSEVLKRDEEKYVLYELNLRLGNR